MSLKVVKRRLVAVAIALAIGGDASGAAPAGRYTAGADTVLDVETGLTWQRAAAPGTYTWADAIAYCDGLTLAGNSDWRLPNIRELQSLVDIRAFNPTIDTVAFPNTPPDYFWSSSPNARSASDAWVVIFDFGYTDSSYQSGARPVRCVR